jgi:hypothetical protein
VNSHQFFEPDGGRRISRRLLRLVFRLTMVLCSLVLVFAVLITFDWVDRGNESAFLFGKAKSFTFSERFLASHVVVGPYSFGPESGCEGYCNDLTARFVLVPIRPVADGDFEAEVRALVVEHFGDRKAANCQSCVATFNWRRKYWIGPRGTPGYVALRI